MRTLPYDYHRCLAKQPDSHCEKCLRWDGLPGQTFGEWQPFVVRLNSADEHCTYIPITKESKQ